MSWLKEHEEEIGGLAFMIIMTSFLWIFPIVGELGKMYIK